MKYCAHNDDGGCGGYGGGSGGGDTRRAYNKIIIIIHVSVYYVFFSLLLRAHNVIVLYVPAIYQYRGTAPVIGHVVVQGRTSRTRRNIPMSDVSCM